MFLFRKVFKMDFSPAKHEILEALLLHNQTPVKAAQIAKETRKPQPTVQMHLIGLVRMGYASSPQKGSYMISENGKRALGLPEVTMEKALAILASASRDKAFHFYADVGKPLYVFAHDLLEFCDWVSKVNVDSLQFHARRGDFEAWFRSLGDEELAMEIALLKTRNLTGEELREAIREAAESRCMTLSKMVGQAAQSP
jgi:DNA-binding transcriptional ArsR family regulator